MLFLRPNSLCHMLGPGLDCSCREAKQMLELAADPALSPSKRGNRQTEA